MMSLAKIDGIWRQQFFNSTSALSSCFYHCDLWMIKRKRNKKLLSTSTINMIWKHKYNPCTFNRNHALILKHVILHFRCFQLFFISIIRISLHGVPYSFPYVVHAAFVCKLHPPYVESDSQLSEFREFTLVFYMIQDVTQWVLYLCVFDSFAHLKKKNEDEHHLLLFFARPLLFNGQR